VESKEQKPRLERWIDAVKDHPVLAVVCGAGFLIVLVATLLTSLEQLHKYLVVNRSPVTKAAPDVAKVKPSAHAEPEDLAQRSIRQRSGATRLTIPSDRTGEVLSEPLGATNSDPIHSPSTTPGRPVEPSASAPGEGIRSVKIDGNDLRLEFQKGDTGLLRCVLPSGQVALTPTAILLGERELRTVYFVQLAPNDKPWHVFLAGAQIATVTVPACSGVVVLLPVGTSDIRTKGIGFGSYGGPGAIKVPHVLAGLEKGPDGRDYGKVVMPRWTGERCSAHIPG
jgi:hypothetical protein